MASRFLYSPLIPELKQIRLVTIAPSPASSEPIRCGLSTYPVEEAPQYNALSYCWGDTDERRLILLQEQQFLVTENLFEALLHLRQPECPTTVWIDAICINQLDAQEKSYQIPLMGQIYARANQVVAWLGADVDDCDMAFKLINEWADIWQKHTANFENHQMAYLSPDLTPLWPQILNSFHVPSWHAAEKLFQRPYWTRLWVTQEVALARGTVLQCGQNKLAFLHLICFSILAVLVRKGNNIRSLAPFQLRMLDNCEYRNVSHMIFLVGARWRRNSEFFDILVLLDLTRGLSCRDLRDKLYAILGLAALGPLPERWSIVPDYERDVDKIHLDFTVSWIQATNSLHILSFAGVGIRISPPCQFLPSWVQDFEGRRNITGCEHKFQAGGQTNVSFEWSPDRHLLSTQGVICAEVLQIVSYCESPEETLANWFASVHDSDVQGPMGSPKLLSLFRTFRKDSRLSTNGLPMFNTAMDREDFYTEAAGFCFALASIVSKDQRNTSSIEEFKRLINDMGIWTTHVEATHTESSPAILTSWSLRFSTVDDIFSCGMQMMEALLLSYELKSTALFITKHGYIGLGRCNAVQVGDRICVLRGCRVPLIIRRGPSHHILIGDCYVNGMMHGEILSEADKGNLEIERIVLQ